QCRLTPLPSESSDFARRKLPAPPRRFIDRFPQGRGRGRVTEVLNVCDTSTYGTAECALGRKVLTTGGEKVPARRRPAVFQAAVSRPWRTASLRPKTWRKKRARSRASSS